MNKIVAGIVFGIIAGIIDVMPMVFQKLTWDANLSAFFLWLVSGFMMSTSNLKLKSPVEPHAQARGTSTFFGGTRRSISAFALNRATADYPTSHSSTGKPVAFCVGG